MKPTHLLKIISPVLLLLLALLACNLPGKTSAPTPDLSVIVAQTQTAMAVNTFLSATPPPQQPTSGATSQSPGATAIATQQVIPATQVTPQAMATEGVIPTTQPPAQPATPITENCKNGAKFIGETIPDGTDFNPGQQFVKSWTLQNAGTCIWSPDYTLVHVNGEQMGGTSPFPIGQTVPPGATIQLNIQQTAPQTTGNYQGYWKLRSRAGQEFGLGQNAEVPFWIKIKVATGADHSQPFAGPEGLGDPDWTVSFDDNRSPWYLGTDSGVDYDLKNGRLTITSNKPTGDKWRVAQPGFLSDFYLQGVFKTGPACSGKDGYGFIVRAPEKAGYVIDSGYVFSFSCDGKYRIYRIDSGNFEAIQNWSGSAAIKSGASQTNIMGIYAKDGEFRLYANGVLVMQFEDEVYKSGLFGLMIRSETSNFQYHVDEVSTWDLD